MRNSKSIKKVKVKTPGGKTAVHFRKKKPSHQVCKDCGKKLNRSKSSVKKLKNLPTTKKRPQRPLPHLCSNCMREYFKEKVRKND